MDIEDAWWAWRGQDIVIQALPVLEGHRRPRGSCCRMGLQCCETLAAYIRGSTYIMGLADRLSSSLRLGDWSITIKTGYESRGRVIR
jgi:hypothetical protein